MILIIILTIIYLYKNIGPEAELDFYLFLVVGIALFTIISVFYLKLKRIIRNNTSFTLYKQNNQVEINGNPFCKNEDLREIIIQTVSGWEGGEPSYTIGISCEKKFFPLTFDQNQNDAEAISAIIGQYFDKGILRKKSKMFSLFSGH